MPVRRRVAVAALAPLLLLAGCQDDPEPLMPSDTVASSPTTTDAPSEVGTVTKETPEEFLRRWQAATDRMQQTGRTGPYLALSQGCKACRDFATQVKDVYSSGGSVDFEGSSIESITRKGVNPMTLEVRVRSAQLRILQGEGKATTFPAALQVFRVILQKVETGWNVTYYGVL